MARGELRCSAALPTAFPLEASFAVRRLSVNGELCRPILPSRAAKVTGIRMAGDERTQVPCCGENTVCASHWCALTRRETYIVYRLLPSAGAQYEGFTP